MKRIILNVLWLNVLALPCLAMFNGVDPMTGEGNYTINLFGMVYSVWFYYNVLKKIIKI